MRTITKKFTFDAGHRLTDYDGKCKHLHGHTYLLEVTVGSEGLDKLGMVMDFGVVKDIFKRSVDPLFDHKLVLKKGDPVNVAICNGLEYAKEVMTNHVTLVDYNPTAENMARHIFSIFNDALKAQGYKDVKCVKIRLYETPTSYAEVK